MTITRDAIERKRKIRHDSMALKKSEQITTVTPYWLEGNKLTMHSNSNMMQFIHTVTCLAPRLIQCEIG